jgi:membrane protease YdiL (CAAX protease family)
VLLGLIWAAWHLPLFFIPEADTAGQSFMVYLLQVTAVSVAMSWLFAHTRGSLLPVMLMHAAVNNTKDIVPSAEAGATNPWALSHSFVAWATLALLWLCAGCFLRLMRRKSPLDRAVAETAGNFGGPLGAANPQGFGESSG